MSANKAFLGHGVFTEYSIVNALDRFAQYGGGRAAETPAEKIDRFVKALRDMNIQNVWIQIFTRKTKFDMGSELSKMRQDLISALSQADISWAGWGYCAGQNYKRDLGWIKEFRDDLGMKAFVIDAEPEEKKQKDVWSKNDMRTFASGVSKIFGIDNVALSTWPCVQIREASVKAILKAAEPYVSLIAPQVYWMDYPGTTHYRTLGYSMSEFPPHDPVAFVRMMIRAWRDAGFAKPLVISGQAYWESSTPKKSVMGFKANQFAAHFDDWDQILGFNWYHAGNAHNSEAEGSMSDEMVAYIKTAKLGQKPYKV